MDESGLPEAEVVEAYRVLRRVNRQLGNLRAMSRELQRFLGEDRPVSRTLSVLDVGSGSGDIPGDLLARLERRGYRAYVLALDRDPTAIALADRRTSRGVMGDALRLPFADASFDLVTAVKFAHHFAGEPLAQLLGEMCRVARRRVVVLDIRRHWFAYWGFIAWSRAFTTSRLVRNDGPLSVLRGFTARELTDCATPITSFDWVVRSYPGYQLALVGRRVAPKPGNTEPDPTPGA